MRFLFWLVVPCLECKHFVSKPKDNTYEHGQCDKFSRYADIARNDETKCGKAGRSFESKEKKD